MIAQSTSAPHSIRSQRGFTLVEIAIVLLILSLLLSFGLSSYSSFTSNSRIRAVGEGIQNGLRQAQTEAIKRNRNVDFVLTDATALSASTAEAATGVATNLGFAIIEPVQNSQPAVFIGGIPPADLTNPPGAAASTKVQVVRYINNQGTMRFTPFGRVAPATGTAAAEYSYGIRSTSAFTNERRLCVVLSPIGRVRMCDKRYAETDPQGCPATACPGL